MPCEKGRHHDHGKMNTYLHTQRAGRWLVVPLAASLAMVLAAVLTGIWSILTGIPVLGLMAWLFAKHVVVVPCFVGEQVRNLKAGTVTHLLEFQWEHLRVSRRPLPGTVMDDPKHAFEFILTAIDGSPDVGLA